MKKKKKYTWHDYNTTYHFFLREKGKETFLGTEKGMAVMGGIFRKLIVDEVIGLRIYLKKPKKNKEIRRDYDKKKN